MTHRTHAHQLTHTGHLRLRETRGFTFPELLFAITLIVVGGVALLYSLTHNLLGIAQNQNVIIAKAAGQREFERYLRKSKDLLEPLAIKYPAGTDFDPKDAAGVLIPGATGTIYIQDIGDGNRKNITVVVNQDGARVYRLTGLFTNWTAGLASLVFDNYPEY